MYSNRLIHAFLTSMLVSMAFGQSYSKRANWRYIGPETTPVSTGDSGDWTCTGMGWVESLYVGEKYMLAGPITGGLYKSKNNGNSWSKIDDDEVQLGSLDLEVVDGIIYRATGQTHLDEKWGMGLLKSTNRGRTWKPTGLTFSSNDKKPLWVIEYGELAKAFLACTPTEIYRSVDTDSWETVFTSEDESFRQVCFSNTNETLVFAAGQMLYQSTNAGRSFTDITNKLTGFDGEPKPNKQRRIAICEDPSVVNRFLVVYTEKNKLYVDESLDAGETWKNLHTSRSIKRVDIHHCEIAVSEGDSGVILIGGVRLFKSTDGGETFPQVTYPRIGHKGYAHDDIRDVFLKNASEFYIATDGGVFKSSDAGDSWEDLTGEGLRIHQIYGLGIDHVGSVWYGGQDIGMMMQQGKGWISIGAVYGDGGDFVEVNDRRIYTVNGRVHELLNGALSSRYMSPPSRKFYFQSPFIKHPNTEDSLHFLVNHVWRYDGKKWKNLSAGLNKGGYKANSFAIAQSNANTMYLSFDQPTWNPNKLKDKLYKSVDGGETWVDITSSLPTLAWKHVTSITINPNNEQEVYISLGMMDRPNDIHKAYKSVDGGKTWENISQGLTHHETFKIQFIHGSKSGIILSAADGVYYRNDQFVYWLKLKGRISNTAVRDFEIDYQEKVLIAGTYGHGPWRMKITKRLLKN